ncbi:PdaC/SigV domain-containing protein [Paenibacillus tengchongensis]|uniref:PdaC/SigV domain-containing protein n=1 Tax=Paenibacillus tengchongensis TaxID=2608684 RepID=UPI00124C4695|nr:DUF4163 domain-containing protein [Paenibacillus tengchongensis]
MNIMLKEQVRKWSAGVLAAGMLLSGGWLPGETGEAAAAPDPAAQSKAANSVIVLKADGKVTNQTGLYQDGKVWVPVTFLRDSLGMGISYDKANNAYTIGKGYNQVRIEVLEYGISTYVNNYYLGDYDGRMMNNRLYVPAELLSDYLGYKGDLSLATGRLNVLKQAQNAITITTEVYASDREDAPIRIEYPQISGLANSEAQQTMNSMIKQSVQKFADASKEQISRKAEDERPYEFDGGYVITYNRNGVLSLVLDQYSYTGGAHGMSYRDAYTFSLKDGKRLLLGDLFGANPNYKKELNAKLSKQLKAEGGYLGGFTGLNTEKCFYLKDGRAVLFFQVYEYTAYASGFPEFTFTFRELLPDGSSPFVKLK